MSGIWDEIREPLRAECVIPTNNGFAVLTMTEPSPDDDIEPIHKLFPMPIAPVKQKEIPVEHPSGKLELKVVEAPEDDPEKLQAWEQEREKVEESRWLAYVDSCLDQEFKAKGDTVQERVAFLKKMPKMVRVKLITAARGLAEKRLSDRYEAAKKE